MSILPPLHVSIAFKWYDLWVGIYVARREGAVYVCPLPCVVVRVGLQPPSKVFTDGANLYVTTRGLAEAQRKAMSRVTDWTEVFERPWRQLDDDEIVAPPMAPGLTARALAASIVPGPCVILTAIGGKLHLVEPSP